MFKKINFLLLLALLSACSQQQTTKPTSQESNTTADPFLWLEEVEGEEAIEWVKARNKKSLDVIKKHPKFEYLYANNKKLYNSNERIPYVSQMNGYLYNFWRDETHVRGLYRRTTMEEYQKDEPIWEIVLDIDALAETDNENWVYKGMSCRFPTYDRCLVNLSRGGADATVIKEFDLESKSFVQGGFFLPEAKSSVAWVDLNTVMVGTDFGEGSMTDSGYPKLTKMWTRGTALTDAPLVFEGAQADVGAWPAVIYDGDKAYKFIVQADTFYTRNWHVLDDNNESKPLDLPKDINLSGLIDGQAILELKSDWQPAATTFEQGDLITINFSDLLQDKKNFKALMQPDANTSISSVSTSKNYVLVNTLKDVSSVMYQLNYDNGEWQTQTMDLPKFGAMSISGTSDKNDDVFINYSNYLTPSTLYYYNAASKQAKPVKSLPAMFDKTGLIVDQHFMTAKDGVRVPYYLIRKEDIEYNGENPTILYGYGGFEVSMRPNYSSIVGSNWLAQGGVYVVANIRGGGEYGPAWHQAALKENRHVAFNDFIGVAEDLIAKNITSSDHLGIIGGSNGGLLVGAVYTMRPDLFNAVVCAVPLLDMKRYNKLLAGASWMAEYGNPDIPEEWAYIKTYSPYHNLSADKEYPKVFFTTSTRDDRVHPGHARKMAALMESMGHEYFYYENIEGGHGGASNNNQAAYLRALTYSYFWHQLAQ